MLSLLEQGSSTVSCTMYRVPVIAQNQVLVQYKILSTMHDVSQNHTVQCEIVLNIIYRSSAFYIANIDNDSEK